MVWVDAVDGGRRVVHEIAKHHLKAQRHGKAPSTLQVEETACLCFKGGGLFVCAARPSLFAALVSPRRAFVVPCPSFPVDGGA